LAGALLDDLGLVVASSDNSKIRRCLKRYVARELFRTLNATALDNT